MTDHGWQEEGCSRHAVRRRQMLCLPVTSSDEGCPASYWRLTVNQDDRGWQDGSRRPDSLVLGRSSTCELQCRQLESDALSHRQPMKRLENRRNVVGAPDSSHQRHPYSYRLVVGTQSVYMWLCIRPLEHIFFGIILTVLVMYHTVSK